MRNFLKIAECVDIVPLLIALKMRPELWNQNKFRTTYKDTPHHDVDDIWIRYPSHALTADTNDLEGVINDKKPVWHNDIPQAKPIILDIMHRVGAYELGRVLITRIKPGGRILPHADVYGDYVQEKDKARYHVVLQGLPGSLYRTGDETVCMRTGEVWWFNALLEHEVMNNSETDRIHLLVDVSVFP